MKGSRTRSQISNIEGGLGSGHSARVIGMWETMMENVVDESDES